MAANGTSTTARSRSARTRRGTSPRNSSNSRPAGTTTATTRSDAAKVREGLSKARNGAAAYVRQTRRSRAAASVS